MKKLYVLRLVIAVLCFSNILYAGMNKDLVLKNGDYKKVPLEKENVVLKIIQSSCVDIEDINNAGKVVSENLKKVESMINKACTEGDKPDIILLHEFPLSGYIYGSREEKLAAALEIPGKESNAIGKLAAKYDTYIIYGCYAKDSEWPGHVLSITTIIGRDGNIVKKIWKPRNIKRFYSSFEITTTTVEGIKDKFIDKYGIEDAFPVIRTEFGNICVSTAQLDPFVFSAFAMQGAEIILRTSTMFFESDVINMAMINNCFSAMANIPGKIKYAGNSMVVTPFGEVMGRLDRENEGILTSIIPMAKFRKNRKLPQYSIELTKHVFNQYLEEIPANHLDLPENELPKSGKEMKTLLDSQSRWLNKEQH